MRPAPVEVNGPKLKFVDRVLRAWRIAKARKYIPVGSEVLDVGCHDGALFRALSDRVAGGVGVDPALARSSSDGRFAFRDTAFPDPGLPGDSFDAITCLAVLEHVDDRALELIRAECERLLGPGGRVIVTVPSPTVDRILHLLQRTRLVAGIATHEHHGAEPDLIAGELGRGFLILVARRRFQLGLNNLFVFRMPVDTRE